MYDNINAEAYYIKLRNNGANLTKANAAFQLLDRLIDELDWCALLESD